MTLASVSLSPALATLHAEGRHVPAGPDACGLGGLLALIEGVESPLPLAEVKVRTRITGLVAHTTVDQSFRNTLRAPMEAVHLFPVPSAGAIVACELRCGDLVVRAACKEKQEAQAVFDDARQRGKRAALLTQERADIHTLRVTNLPPGEEITVRIEIVERLNAEDGRVLWRFPTVIAPRYLPGRESDHTGPGVLPNTDRVPDASHLSPPLLLSGGTRLDLEVVLDGAPARIESSLHALSVGFEGGIRLAPAGDARCDRDFVLAVTWADPVTLNTRAWTDGAYTLVHIEPPLTPAKVLNRDAMFVVDISGSMAGSKIEAARRALTAALHGLNAGDRFALTAFDDRLEHYSADFVAYDAASLEKADRWIAALRPRGGTEMLPAIVHALKGTVPAGRLRTVLFVTDGQAHNEQELVAAVTNRRVEASRSGGEARFFTLGIDTAVNEALLGRLARMGGGTATFATPSDDIEAVVARMEARFGSPVAIDVRVSGDGVEAARPEPEAIFAGVSVGMLLKGAPAQLGLNLRTSGGNELTVIQNVVLQADRGGQGPGTLGALWARERVAMLEDRLTLKPFEEEALRPEIIRVALGAAIASRFTSFVAVEETRTVSGERVTVVQPHAMPAQWEMDEDTASPAMRSAPTGHAAMGGSVAPKYRGAPAMSRSAPSAPPPPASMGARAPSPRAAAPMKSASLLDRMTNLFTGGSPGPGMVRESAADADEEYDAFMMPAPAAESAKGDGPRSASLNRPADGVRPDAQLAATQGADGSFGGDVARTAAALLVLVLLGSTRTAGLRKRNVQKAAAWLATRTEPVARMALDALAAAERGERVVGPWPALNLAGPEGALLAGM